MTGRLGLLIGLFYGILLVGLLFVQGEVLVLAIPLLVLIGYALWSEPGPLRLHFERHVDSDYVALNRPVNIQVSITNQGDTVEEVLVREKIDSALELVKGSPAGLGSLLPAETLTLHYVLRGPRGRFEFSDVHALATDSFGLFRRSATFASQGHFSVLPDVWKLHTIPVRPPNLHGFAGTIPARLGGAGTDFLEVRGYQPGDPRRKINWRVSARHSEALFTNEFEQERVTDVGLILDARLLTDVQTSHGSLFEYSVRATASLADSFLADGHRVGLLIYGRALERTFPGYGKIQRNRILRALADAAAEESSVFRGLEYLPARFFPARSQLILISPLCSDDQKVLMRLRAAGYHLLVVSPDGIEFANQAYERNTPEGFAVRIAHVERKLILQRLERAGIQVVDWPVTKSLDAVLRVAAARLSRAQMMQGREVNL